MYSEKFRYENLQHGFFEAEGKYDIPKLTGSDVDEIPELIGFNYAKTAKDRTDKGVHFFLDDYQFTRVWNNPTNYIELLKQFRIVLTPDFSLYSDFPRAMQIYNHYRKHWLGAYWESNCIKVIPTICWSDESSFEWCFEGEPVGSIVAVSSVGTQQNKNSKRAFLLGYEKMLERLQPETIIFYGNIPDECKGSIVRIKTFQDKFRKAVISNRRHNNFKQD
ncbi:MAG: DUF4417 domain-containing protein [Ruminococcus sp.]|nr:DUF4417 domain-containing protein [Ruminococcus sp.]